MQIAQVGSKMMTMIKGSLYGVIAGAVSARSMIKAVHCIQCYIITVMLHNLMFALQSTNLATL